MRKTHCSTKIMERKLKNMKNQTQTLFDLEYGEKHTRSWKMRNTHCRTRTIARKLKKKKTWKMTHKHGRTWNMARNT